MGSFLLLLIVAIAVAGLHMAAPDHWVPLITVSIGRNYSRRRKYEMAAAIGLGHGSTSAFIAVLALAAGLTFLGPFVSDLFYLSEGLLVIIGIYFVLIGYRDGGREISSGTGNSMLLVSIFPDLALMPILLSGAGLPLYEISSVLLSFIVATVLSLTLITGFSSSQIGLRLSRLEPNRMDYAIAAMLFGTAMLLFLFPGL